MTRPGERVAMGVVLAALAPFRTLPLPAQTAPAGRTTVIAGAHYRAGWLHRLLLGAHYRDLWTAPLEVDVLDLSRVAGGLTPSRCGGRRQTISLRLLGADGREYVFRSVDKDPTLALPPELRATFARSIIQDQISSAHPGGPLVVAPLLDAAGVLHAEPRLVALPDDARLTGFDCVHAGMLGMIEERPTEPPDNEPGFAGAAELASTKKLFEHLENDADHRIDSRAFLAARLMDVFIGDWDRHHDQWRWARFDSGGVHWWRPIPRDRDQAFARLDGVLVWVAGFYQPQLIGFGEDYPSIWRITYSGRVVDRRLLVDLERSVWDSTARALQARLTDSVIDAAVRRLPTAYYRRSGLGLVRALQRRRDRLPEMAGRFYALLAAEVEVHGTDKRDVAEVERRSDGRVAVRLSRPGAAPYFRRTFDRRETDEVRLYLHGGDDRLAVRGSDGSGPVLRVIGGAGDDELADSSRGGRTWLYDDRGDNRFTRGPGTRVDRRRYEAPPLDTSSLAPPRDWGSLWLPLAWVSYAPDIGLFVGGGMTRTRYGFRRLPYRSQVQVRAGYATDAQTYRAELRAEFPGLLAPASVSLRARASGLDVIRFYGFGNETVDTGSLAFHKVKQQQYLVAPALELGGERAARVSFGPVFKIARTRLEAGTLVEAIRPYGVAEFTQIGAAGDVRCSLYPRALDVTASFGEAHAEVSTYLTAPVALRPTLALRVAGKKIWGPYPLHEAAYVGGWNTVRGFPEGRFAGGAAAYGNVELRLSLARFFLLLPNELGAFGLADAGRVFVSGETSDRWHAAAGGGVWIAFLSRANTLSVAAVHSAEGTRIYARAGFSF
ncbi:MAG: hypothetical protein DMD71_08025 [Gemmatimonadetes bacterium]|nr:MAG: hypothetical protein DMD71_08025 [Gemmatimonadota bacterium]